MDRSEINKIRNELNLGSAERYPHGKPFNKSDEGELKSAIVKDVRNSKMLPNDVFIIFGKSVEWLALTKSSAKDFGMMLISIADKEQYDMRI